MSAFSLFRRRWQLIFSFILLIFILGLWSVPPVWTLRQDSVSRTVWKSEDNELIVKMGPAETGWIPYQRLSLHVIHAILVSEDSRFFEHSGIDLREIWKSLLINLQAGRFVRGGSTITQQLVRNVFLSREKTLLRKFREISGALLLEIFLSKKDILTWYMNLLDLGNGVVGIGEAAEHYFHTDPELLTIPQSVHLALILPAPYLWSKGLRQRSLTAFGHRRFGIILDKMRLAGFITELQWEQARATGNFGSPVQAFPRRSSQTDIRSSN